MEEIERRKQVAKEHNFDYQPQYLDQFIQETGIYQASFAHNFPHTEFLEYKPWFNGGIPFELLRPDFGEKDSYGVADNIEQIKEYYKEQIEDPNNSYFIDLTPVFQDKDNAGKGGGWRWHKWGEYIGKLNPQYEYLDDEDFGEDFQYIICFHIYKIPN